MICVSIARGRHKMMIAEYRHLAESGVRLVELRVDFIAREVNLKRLLADQPCPAIITCRRESDGGKWNGDEFKRQVLLRSAIADGVDYVDLEEDIADKIPRFGNTKRIISLHNFRETPDNLEEIHERLAGMDADVVKIATMAHHPHDNVRMLDLIKNAKVPTVGVCMGEIGMPSRILAGKFGAPFTFATFHHERQLAPGQLSYDQMAKIYNYDEINEATEVYGVVADPVGHSLSPLIHNRAMRELKLNKVYVPFRVPRESLAQFFSDCEKFDIKGLSVTIPHKEAVIKLLNKADSAVKGIGAANTVVFKDEDRLGYNSDYRAAMDSLLATVSDKAEGEKPLKGKKALVLGAGGVARAISYGLTRYGADVVISGRTGARASELAGQLKCKFVEWNERHSVNPDILINGTPVGMHPNVDESPFESRHLNENIIVFDTIYNPEQTLLIKEAKSEGCPVITGVDMFVRQAAIQFKLFTGQDAPTDLMRKEVKRATGAAKF